MCKKISPREWNRIVATRACLPSLLVQHRRSRWEFERRQKYLQSNKIIIRKYGKWTYTAFPYVQDLLTPQYDEVLYQGSMQHSHAGWQNRFFDGGMLNYKNNSNNIFFFFFLNIYKVTRNKSILHNNMLLVTAMITMRLTEKRHIILIKSFITGTS